MVKNINTQISNNIGKYSDMHGCLFLHAEGVEC